MSFQSHLEISRQSANLQVFIRGLDGRSFALTLDKEATITTLQRQIFQKTKLSPHQQLLSISGKVLDRRKTLSSYGIVKASTINLSGRLQGGGLDPHPLPFVDVALRIERISLPPLPNWKKAKKGLNLKGLCETDSCPAYKQWFWVNKGMGKFNMHKEISHVSCPECNQETAKVNEEKFGLCDCTYSYHGQYKATGPDQVEQTKEVSETCHAPRRGTRERFLLFESPGQKRNWTFLEMTVEEREDSDDDL